MHTSKLQLPPAGLPSTESPLVCWNNGDVKKLLKYETVGCRSLGENCEATPPGDHEGFPSSPTCYNELLGVCCLVGQRLWSRRAVQDDGEELRWLGILSYSIFGQICVYLM